MKLRQDDKLSIIVPCFVYAPIALMLVLTLFTVTEAVAG